MIRSLVLRNFKRFEALDIDSLRPVNLVAGTNNSGKTGILEALAVAATDISEAEIVRLFRRQDADFQGSAVWLKRNGTEPFFVGLKCESKSSRGRGFADAALAAGFERTTFGGEWIDPDYERLSPAFSQVAVSLWPVIGASEASLFDRLNTIAGAEEQFEALLRSVEPKLKTVRNIGVLGHDGKEHRLLHAAIEGVPIRVPLSQLGHGVSRLASIFVGTIRAKAQLLLIDEIETGLHYSAMTDLWRGLKVLVEEEGTQIFATTHSMDCIEAASEVFGTQEDSLFAVHRIEDVRHRASCVSIAGHSLQAALTNGFEIR